MTTAFAERRRGLSLTQREVAERIAELGGPGASNIDPGTVHRWERGARKPSMFYLRLLVAVFDASAEELGFGPPMRGPVGDRIRVFRTRRGLTQAALAELVGRSPRWLRRVEAGESDPGLGELREVARVLRLDVVSLIEDPEP